MNVDFIVTSQPGLAVIKVKTNPTILQSCFVYPLFIRQKYMKNDNKSSDVVVSYISNILHVYFTNN